MRLSIAGLACLTLCGLASEAGACSARTARAEPVLRAATHDDADTTGTRRPSFGQIPLSFEANQGQASGPAQFLARGRGYSLVLNPEGAVLALSRDRVPRATAEPEDIRAIKRALLRMTLAGANPAPSGGRGRGATGQGELLHRQ